MLCTLHQSAALADLALGESGLLESISPLEGTE
jgi:hypothetical protein